jgi:hypothetical protein
MWMLASGNAVRNNRTVIDSFSQPIFGSASATPAAVAAGSLISWALLPAPLRTSWAGTPARSAMIRDGARAVRSTR